jgi:hypothetical protein
MVQWLEVDVVSRGELAMVYLTRDSCLASCMLSLPRKYLALCLDSVAVIGPTDVDK